MGGEFIIVLAIAVASIFGTNDPICKQQENGNYICQIKGKQPIEVVCRKND